MQIGFFNFVTNLQINLLPLSFSSYPVGQAKVSHELTSFHMSETSPEAHAPAVTLQMPHLPVTAVTRISEKFSGETVCSTGTNNASAGLLGQSKSKNAMAAKTSNQSGNRQK